MKNREVINSYIDKWIEDYNNRQRPVWNYEDGCVMLGAQYLYEATGDEKYINCIRTFMDRYIQEDGTIRYYVPEDYNLDKVNNGRVLYFLYDQTGEEKYKIALSHIREQLETHPLQTAEASGISRYIRIRSGWTDYIWGSLFIWNTKRDLMAESATMILQDSF